MLRAAIVAGFLAGCSHPKPDTTPAASAPSAKHCPQIADVLIATFDKQHEHALPDDLEKAFRDMVVERCTQDAWTGEAQDCFVAPGADMDTCTMKLTEAQRESFQKHAEKLAADAEAKAKPESD